MDELRCHIPYNSISVISGWCKGEHEGLCAMKCHLGLERISPPMGFQPETLWSEVRSANCLATLVFHLGQSWFNTWLGWICEPCHEKMCLRESPTRQDTNWPAQLQTPARILKFRIYKLYSIIWSWQWTTKVLIRLRECAGWSVPLLFTYGIRHIFSWPGSFVFDFLLLSFFSCSHGWLSFTVTRAWAGQNPQKLPVWPTKTQLSTSAQSDQSSLCALRVAKDPYLFRRTAKTVHVILFG